MDKIEVVESKLSFPEYEGREILFVHINGERLDEYISGYVSRNYLGLISPWLDLYDDECESSVEEKNFVWKQTELGVDEKILPILLCPDDFDFSCTVIVAEVVNNKDTVVWSRIGVDISKFNPNGDGVFKYIGSTIEWFNNIRPLIFCKNEYTSCIDVFIRWNVEQQKYYD